MSVLGVLEYHSKNLFEKYFLNSENPDVTLCVGERKIPAHRFVLGVESEYFKTLLQGDFKEASEGEVKIDANEDAFILFLKYLYCGTLDLRAEKIETILDLLGLAHKCLSSKLKFDISKYLPHILKVENVLTVLSQAKLYDLPELEFECFEMIDSKAELIFFQDDFLDSPKETFMEIFSRKTKNISEEKAFQVALKWISRHSELVIKDNDCFTKIMSLIDLSCLSYQRIKDDISSLKYFDDLFISSILEKYEVNETSKTVISRKNLAVPAKGFKVIEGVDVANLILEGENYTQVGPGKKISVDLGHQFTVNCIEFKLKNKNTGYDILYSNCNTGKQSDYYLICYGGYKCFGSQKLYFNATNLRNLKIRSQNDNFFINSFKMFSEQKPPQIREYVVIPTENIINEQHVSVSSTLLEENKTPLIISVFENRGLDTPYYTHTAENHIAFEFNQPYWIRSCRLRLWDFDGRRQSFDIDIVDKTNTVVTVYKGQDFVRNWIEVTFSETIVTAIWITGTGSTAGDELRLAYFEAPSMSIIKAAESSK